MKGLRWNGWPKEKGKDGGTIIFGVFAVTRNLPLALAIPVSSGSDPDVIEIEDASEVYGDDFPEIDDLCPKNHFTRQHEYSKTYFNFGRCVHCHQPSGLDR